MPKKAKKGGGGKGGGRTEEERLLLLQQRAQAEEEVAKKKEEILTLFLKDKLQKEERNTSVNLLKLHEGWRSILRRSRAGGLQEELEELSQSLERRLDGLDSVVKNLGQDLQEAERQGAQVRRAHLQQVERLWAHQDRRLVLVQQRWEDGLQHLSSRFTWERTQVSSRSQQQRDDLEDATFTLKLQHQVAMEAIHLLYGETMAAYESAQPDRTHTLDQDKTKNLIHQGEKVLQNCREETQQLSGMFHETQHMVDLMEADVKNMKKLQDAIIHLRTTLDASQVEHVSEEQDLTDARDQLSRKTRALQDQLTQAQSAVRKQLTELTAMGDKATKKLQEVIVKGQKVLRVAEMCQKMESEQKSLFTGVSSSLEELRQDGAGPAGPVKEIPELQQLTRRISASVLQQEAVRKQRDDLSRENEQLRLLLRRRLDAMTVSDLDLDGHHALLAVRRAPTTTASTNTGRRHTVIEAVHAVKHSL